MSPFIGVGVWPACASNRVKRDPNPRRGVDSLRPVIPWADTPTGPELPPVQASTYVLPVRIDTSIDHELLIRILSCRSIINTRTILHDIVSLVSILIAAGAGVAPALAIEMTR